MIRVISGAYKGRKFMRTLRWVVIGIIRGASRPSLYLLITQLRVIINSRHL